MQILAEAGQYFVVVLNQVATIYVGIGGYLDDIEVYKMREILAEFGLFVNDNEYFWELHSTWFILEWIVKNEKWKMKMRKWNETGKNERVEHIREKRKQTWQTTRGNTGVAEHSV